MRVRVPSAAGKKTWVAGVLNSWMVWRQAPQGWLAVVVEVGDDDGSDVDGGAVLADGGGDSGLLGAGGEPVGGVFDVAAGEDGSVVEEKSRAYAEVAVGGVGMVCDCDGALVEVGDLG